MGNLFDKLFSIPFPDTCIVCGKPVEQHLYACNKCEDEINYINTAFKCRTCLSFLYNAENGMCGNCLLEKPEYERLISCVKYTGRVKNSMQAYKFRNRPDYHLGFSKLACEVLDKDGDYFDAVVCMPLSKKSLKERGYNQSALIAKRIADFFEVPFFEDLLIKTKETKRQSELKLDDRKKNIKGAFTTSQPERINGLRILLVDDIFTSGSTMREAARVLSPHTDSIIAFTIARAQFK